MNRWIAAACLCLLPAPDGLAAPPPDLVNFQGVLRNASNQPESGTFDMTFFFYDAATGGNEVLFDRHHGTLAVTVSGGLFNVELGGGNVADGSGPGIYTTLTAAFHDHTQIHVEVEVRGERLSPRIPIRSAAHALNAEHASRLDGLDAAQLLRSDASTTYAAGTLTTGVGTQLDVNGNLDLPAGGITGAGPGSGLNADLLDGLSSAGFAAATHTHASLGTGSGITGGPYNGGTTTTFALGNLTSNWTQSGAFDVVLNNPGSELRILESAGTFLGTIDMGDLTANETYVFDGAGGTVWTTGNDGGGSGMAADTLDGLDSLSFLRRDAFDVATGRITFTGDPLGTGVSLGSVYVNPSTAATNETIFGVSASGAELVKVDKEGDTNINGNLAVGNDAVVSADIGTNSRIELSSANDIYGLYARAEDPANGAGFLVVGVGAHAAATAPGNTNKCVGLYATAEGGTQNWAVEAWTDSGIVALYGRAVQGYGTYSLGSIGGNFEDLDTSAYAEVGTGTYKITGNGSLAFTQNHPESDDRVIVYNAPEGDEVATYTRGHGRMESGVARIALGPTFAWVTNPDVGLTAYVTARERDAGLYVESITTAELVVRSLDAASRASFDYVVYGLRIGFEEVSIVQEKRRDARIPSMVDHRAAFDAHPELRQYAALQRFERMSVESGDASPAAGRALAGQSSAGRRGQARALHDAIGEFDPRVDVVDDEPPPIHGAPASSGGARPVPAAPRAGAAPRASVDRGADPVRGAATGTATMLPVDSEGNVYGRSFRTSLQDLAQYMPSSGPVEAGDVLVADLEVPGAVRACASAADAAVIGIAVGDPGVALQGGMAPIADADPELAALLAAAQARGDKEQASRAWRELVTRFRQANTAVALSGVLACKVDAGYGPIRVGDLLVTSPSPGRAMRADAPAPGTVVAKALEPLADGTGTIRVLVMPR